MTERVGEQIGNYLLRRLIGKGSFGDVYLTEDMRTHQPVAVKLLKTQLTNPQEVRTFINEARIIRLRHPHIVSLLDFGIHEANAPYLAMDYAPNGSLAQLHPWGTQVPLSHVVSYVRQIADALQYAHEMHIVHRDVKPQNMLLGKQNEVLLSDFGIALTRDNTANMATMQGIAGTALYMAPEQFRGNPLPASDQYALAIVVYQWLCGEMPFQGNTWELLYQHLEVPPAPLRTKNAALSEKVEQVVLRALSKKPEERYPSIIAFALALERAAQGYVKTRQLHDEYAAIAPAAGSAFSPSPYTTPYGSTDPFASTSGEASFQRTPMAMPDIWDYKTEPLQEMQPEITEAGGYNRPQSAWVPPIGQTGYFANTSAQQRYFAPSSSPQFRWRSILVLVRTVLSYLPAILLLPLLAGRLVQRTIHRLDSSEWQRPAEPLLPSFWRAEATLVAPPPNHFSAPSPANAAPFPPVKRKFFIHSPRKTPGLRHGDRSGVPFWRGEWQN